MNSHEKIRNYWMSMLLKEKWGREDNEEENNKLESKGGRE